MIHHLIVFYFFRDLSSVRAEVTKSVRVVQGACMDLDKNLRGMDANTQFALEEERARCQKVHDAFFFPLVWIFLEYNLSKQVYESTVWKLYWKYCSKAVICIVTPNLCKVQMCMVCNPVVQHDLLYHIEVRTWLAVDLPIAVLFFCRLRSNFVKKYRNLLSFRTNMTMKRLILWWGE